MHTEKHEHHEKHSHHEKAHEKPAFKIGDKVTFAKGKTGTIVNIHDNMCCVDETAGTLIESVPANHFENEGGSFREWVAVKELKIADE